MYTPRRYREDDPAVLQDLIRRYNFGTLFTHDGTTAHVTHLPFLLDSERGPHGTLVAHMARANPHWKAFADTPESLAVFLGAHSYITPGWYDPQSEVPTWNYAAVHARGPVRIVSDEERLREMVARLVVYHEEPAGCPWNREEFEQEATDKNIRGIVGFEMEIAHIEGKSKFSQNRSRGDQKNVITALEGSDDPLQREVADIMRRNLERKAPEG